MQVRASQGIVIFIAALLIILIYQLSSILAPFLFAALLAYLMDPLVNKLQRWHLSHLISVIIVFTTVFAALVLLVLMLFPLIEIQANALLDVIPQIMQWLQHEFIPRLQEYVNIATLKTTLTNAMPKPGTIVNTVLHSGYLIIAWVINLILIPVVTFYFLRDWTYLCNNLEKSLPKRIRPSVMELMREFDAVLSAFFRGQFLVMLGLGFIYGIGLTVAGLSVGLALGIVGGILSIVPYLGSGFVLISSTVIALVQYGNTNTVYYVWAVFLIGQAIEGYVLVPYLVGNRIGLHPVVVIFSIMAGGALFGFFGVLVALPAAALIKVLLRFVDVKYQLC